jgi:hypothetical protein
VQLDPLAVELLFDIKGLLLRSELDLDLLEPRIDLSHLIVLHHALDDVLEALLVALAEHRSEGHEDLDLVILARQGVLLVPESPADAAEIGADVEEGDSVLVDDVEDAALANGDLEVFAENSES